MKLGLALSGGGFRAAFFHLGVMTRLARRGALRHVQVISTVSGGSIIGAYYYLRLQALLETIPAQRLTDEHYLSMLNTIEEDFLAAVQRNMRFRTFSNVFRNWEMARASYSRSDRFGEILDKFLYLPIWREREPGREVPVTMRDLVLRPAGWDRPLDPRKDHLGHGSEAPLLVINATSLNSGHSWRFEPTTMGEPVPNSPWEWDIDRSVAFAQPDQYANVSGAQANFPLGAAVAASAAVPGLFQPLAISDMYPDARVQLVDGGVFENQGLAALLKEDCTHFVVSDAGGQLAGGSSAPNFSIAVLLRSSGIQYGRIRELQFERLIAGRGARNIALVHTMGDVRPPSIPWIGPAGDPLPIPEKQQPRKMPSPVHRGVQERLSRVRTDLDSFSDVEAKSLMCAGYLQAGPQLEDATGITESLPAEEPNTATTFDFLDAEPWVTASPPKKYLRHLRASQSRFFKPFRLMKVRATLLGLVVYAIVITPFFFIIRCLIRRFGDNVASAWHSFWMWAGGLGDLGPVRWFLDLKAVASTVGRFPTHLESGWLLFTLALGVLFALLVLRYLPTRIASFALSKVGRSVPILNRVFDFTRIATAVFIWIFVWVSLQTLDRLFLWYGTIDHLGPPPPRPE